MHKTTGLERTIAVVALLHRMSDAEVEACYGIGLNAMAKNLGKELGGFVSTQVVKTAVLQVWGQEEFDRIKTSRGGARESELAGRVVDLEHRVLDLEHRMSKVVHLVKTERPTPEWQGPG